MNYKLKTIVRAVCTALAAALPLPSALGQSGPVSGEVTPKIMCFDNTGGVGGSYANFFDRYSPQQSWSGNRESGCYGALDLNLAVAGETRNVLEVDWRGYGWNNTRGFARGGDNRFGVTGYFQNYRSFAGGVDYLYTPNRVPNGTDPTYFFPAQTNANSGYGAQFNDDSDKRGDFKTDRTTYGLGLNLKPSLFGSLGSVNLNYDGYQRDGNSFVTYVLGGGDVRQAGTNAQPPQRVLQRWRGIEQTVNENMNRFTLGLNAAPGGFNIAYEGAIEKFDNQAKNYTHADITLPPAWQYDTGGDATRPLGFVPDSTLITNALRVSKAFANTAVAAGVGMTRLEQDSFTTPQQRLGYTTGKISTTNAYFRVNQGFTSTLNGEAYAKYFTRDNDSSYPVPGLISAADSQTLGVRINGIDQWEYGLSATLRSLPLRSSITAGWAHVDRDRELTFNQTGIIPSVSLYRDQSTSNEFYLRWISRPMPAMTLRVTPSYLDAKNTGLVTDPDRAFKLKTLVTYAVSLETTVNAYYNLTNWRNDNNAFTDKSATPVSRNQDVSSVAQTAGISLGFAPSEELSTSVSFDWNRNDLEAYYFSTNRRRFEVFPPNAVIFAIRDRSRYLVDTYSVALNGEWQMSALLRLNGGYTFTRSSGDIASGLIESELSNTVDGKIDNNIHTFSIGASYFLRKGVTLRATYIFDYYDDNSYDQLSGGVHTIMAGVSVGF